MIDFPISKYSRRWQDRHGLIKSMGMSMPIDLESLYTPAKVLKKMTLTSFDINNDVAAEDSLKQAVDNQYLTVLGGVGIGKTTLLKRAGLEALRGESGQFEQQLIPVLLELKNFNKSVEVADLVDAIASEFAIFGCPPEFARQALSNGQLLILLDGLDEAPAEFTDSIMNAIDALVDVYRSNRFVVSCRTAAYHSNLQDFRVIELAGFDDEQIRQFINNWFDAKPNQAQEFWETLHADSSLGLKELARTPLMLNLLCVSQKPTASISKYKHTIFNTVLDLLLENWAAQKRVLLRPIYENLPLSYERAMLSKIAYKGYEENRQLYNERELVRLIAEFLKDFIDDSNYIDGKKILDSIAIQQGVLVKRGVDTYSFFHPVLQEYLASLHMDNEGNPDYA